FSDSASAGNQNWEDLYEGGDQDFTDINTEVTVTLETTSGSTLQGDVGSAIELPDISSTLADTDGSETLALEISAIPDGAVLSDGNGNAFTATADSGSVDVSSWSLNDLTVTPAEGSPDFDLQVTATSTEASNGDTASAVQSISIEIADQVIEGTSGAENLQGAGGDDTITGGAGNDAMFGGDGNDTFIFEVNEGNDTASGGSGWTDAIQLDGFTGSDSQQGWTLTLDGGGTILSTDEDINEILLSEDSSGTIAFDDGGNIDFDGIEKIIW
ncbi:MAG: hypothetical protein JKY59_00900, partial [Emcibacter sp.]|nr:hypothetical protein [Emcibacter sp.]